MSQSDSSPNGQRGAFNISASWIREHEAEIRREANSDAPDAWVFQELLDSVDGLEGDES